MTSEARRPEMQVVLYVIIANSIGYANTTNQVKIYKTVPEFSTWKRQRRSL